MTKDDTRPLLWALLAVLVILLIAISLWSYFGNWGSTADAQEPDSAVLLALDKRALDAAYEAQLQKLFAVWLTHPGGEDKHFKNGLRIARKAYGQAAAELARREQDLAR